MTTPATDSSQKDAHTPNADTIAAIEEGWRIAHDPNAESYDSIEDLRKALNI